MKTARQYADEIAFWVESQRCVLDYHELKSSGNWKPEHAHTFRDHTASQMLTAIPLEEFEKCVEAAKHMLSTKPKSRDRLAAMAGLIHALADFDRKAGK